jgi:glycopeptide antibiotics resistance protein
MMEMMQYFSMSGTLDIDDVFLNMIGALIGYVICPLKATPGKQTLEV